MTEPIPPMEPPPGAVEPLALEEPTIEMPRPGGSFSDANPANGKAPAAPHNPYAVLAYSDFLLYTLGRNIAAIGQRMLGLGVGWELYLRTGHVMALGWVGLVQALPVILLALPAGHWADRFNRQRMALMGEGVLVLCSVGLLLISLRHGSIPLIYLCLLGASIARAASGPARAALLPQLVPREMLSNAIAWNASISQLSGMLGPAFGGALIGWTKVVWPVYAVDTTFGVVFCITLIAMRQRPEPRRETGRATMETLLAGIRFVRDTRIVLATITLDLFAVLLGGATSLMPVYARDILHVGPGGLGWLTSAPSAGAAVMALLLAHLPPMRHAGRSMLLAVATFGVGTIVFGLSHSFGLSLTMLFVLGAVDNISVVVRHTLVQILTPDETRGRVSAVNNVFISSSNDLGGFESGLVAHWLGPIVSVVSGGIGTVLVVLATAIVFPELRRFGSLTGEGRRGK